MNAHERLGVELRLRLAEALSDHVGLGACLDPPTPIIGRARGGLAVTVRF